MTECLPVVGSEPPPAPVNEDGHRVHQRLERLDQHYLRHSVTDSTTGWTYIFVSGVAPVGTVRARARPDVLATGAAAEVH